MRTWSLTGAAFESLLAALDPDRARAAERYEAIRARLMKFFEWRGCADPQEQTDLTIDRVARRLAEGAPLTTSDPYQFAYGVALNVLKEHWRSVARTHLPLDAAGPDVERTHDSESNRVQLDARIAHERRLECLEHCLGGLAPDNRALIARYHLDPAGGRVDGRRVLAASLGIPVNALRIRVFRLRQALERCIMKCLGDSRHYYVE
jgi:DNA-directed RNA polymerase specialized sigma24 family protein